MSENILRSYVCSKCKNHYNRDYFYKSSVNKSGYDHICKNCRKQISKDWGNNNKEKRKAYWQKYSPQHQIKVAQHRKNNPKEVRAKDKKNHSKETSLYTNAKSKNKKRNIPFLLSFDEFREIRKSGRCFYCQSALPTQGYGIDRVNSELPYTFENCVPCCKFCNKAKGSLTSEEFIKQIRKIYKTALLNFAK